MWADNCWKYFANLHKKFHIIGGISANEIEYLNKLGVTISISEYRHAYQKEIKQIQSEIKVYQTDFHFEIDESLEACVVFLLRHDSFTSHFAFATWLYALCNETFPNIDQFRFYVDRRDIFKDFPLSNQENFKITFKHNKSASSLICYNEFRYVTIIV